jgi:hypothetical protein
VSGCKTTFNKGIGAILLGRWEYDRRGLGSLWVKVNNAEFVDVIGMTC